MAYLTRRQFMGAATVAGSVGGVAWLQPTPSGAPHEPYFATLNHALHQAGIGTPTMVLDLVRMRHNADQVKQHVQGRIQLRLVNKSLPCLNLLHELSLLTGTQRQMVFSLPYLHLITQHKPQSDVLLGKPLPVAAAAHYYASRSVSGFEPAKQLQWLVDTPERLKQYSDLARAQQQTMRINIEIDVGLHRGGVPDLAAMQTMVQMIMAEPLLQWAGLMGYDAHTEKIPELIGLRQEARLHAAQTYKRFADYMQQSPLKGSPAGPTLNTGGSPSFRLHDGMGAANEVAVGSAMVKPTDFDTPLLSDFLPAAFIATPVLKTGPFVAPDGVEFFSRMASAWDANQRHSVFIYGGQWMAQPVSPEGLSASALIGKSSNQQILLGSGKQGLRPDDFVFLRPTQSEAVLQQFGDIAVYEHGRITDMWPVFPAQA
ncbi:MAG: alanine racemase [Aquabacterium sp.]|nr:alanine racemase [Aquabacterium sp.]